MGFSGNYHPTIQTTPVFLKDAEKIIRVLKNMQLSEIASAMKMSNKLSMEAVRNYNTWNISHTNSNSLQAIYSYTGDVYQGLQPMSFESSDMEYAQERILILSGLYGILKPCDLIQPYRLEMNSRLAIGSSKNLYRFWGEKLSEKIINACDKHDSKIIINLASAEYYKSVKNIEKKHRVISPVFLDFSKGSLKMISYYTKRARGLMAAWIIKERIESEEQLILFNSEFYQYSAEHSTPEKPAFIR